MYQKFFTNTIESKFIKALLYNTYVPIYKTVVEGDYIHKNCYYCYNRSIIKCTTSGEIGGNPRAVFTTVDSYNFGKKKGSITQNYVSKYYYYDSETHKYLGNYLRLIRDYYTIDLMPYYNCFNNSYVNTFYFTDSEIVAKQTDIYKIAQVPIKYNRTYTIAIDSESKILMRPMVMSHGISVTTMASFDGNKHEINIHEAIKDIEVSSELTKLNNSIISAQTLTFKNPVTIRVNNKETNDGFSEILERNERNLYLMIQTPMDNDSSLVVLEGDYTNLDTRRIINLENIWKEVYVPNQEEPDIVPKYQNEEGKYITKDVNSLSQKELNDLLLTNLSLMQMNNKVSYAFTGRLIEYLLLNVIHSDDEIFDNIKYIQELVESYNYAYSITSPHREKIYGTFDNYLRAYLYESFINSNKCRRLDINGFVDKDTEEYVVKKAAMNQNASS